MRPICSTLLTSLSCLVLAVSAAAQVPSSSALGGVKTIDWPETLPAVTAFHEFHAWDPWGDQRPSAVGHFDGSLYLIFSPAIHEGIFPMSEPWAVTGVLPLRQADGSDKLLVTGAGGAALCTYATNGSITFAPVLDAAWTDADQLVRYVDANGATWVVGRAADGQTVQRAWAPAGGALIAAPPIPVGESIRQLVLTDWTGDGAPDVMVMTASGFWIVNALGGAPLHMPSSWINPHAVGIRTPVGDYAVVIDVVPGLGASFAVTMNGSTMLPGIALDELELGLLVPGLVVTGVTSADSDGDGLHDDVMVAHIEGHSILLMTDLYATPDQRGVAIGDPGSQSGPRPCLANFDNDGNDDYLAWDSSPASGRVRLALGVSTDAPSEIETDHWVNDAEYDFEQRLLYVRLDPAVDPSNPTVLYDQFDARVWYQPTHQSKLQFHHDIPLQFVSELEVTIEGETQHWLVFAPFDEPIVEEDEGKFYWPNEDRYFIELRFYTGDEPTRTQLEGFAIKAGVHDNPAIALLEWSKIEPPNEPVHVRKKGRPTGSVGVIVTEVIPPDEVLDLPAQ